MSHGAPTPALNEATCGELLYYGAIPTGDPDISGIGVVSAFLVSAYLTFFSILLAYFTGFVEKPLLNVVDQRVFHIRPYAAKNPHYHAAIRKAVLAFSDQQIVTGIAIMGAGFQGLRTGAISVYHFQIVLYLAWMSSSVHLSALTLLRPYLNLHLGIRTWRLVGMLILLVMLVVGFVPTVSNAWGLISPFRDINYGDTLIEGKTGWAVPAKCFWLGTYGSQVNPDAPLGLCLLLISYIWKTGDLFDWPREGYTRYWRNPIDQGFEHVLYFSASRYMKTKHQIWLWLYRFTLPWYIVITASLECIASFSGALWVSLLGILFGTLQILVPRQQNITSTGSKENEWGFGQLVPLILLVQPLGAITEVIWLREGHRRSTVVLHESDLVTAPTFDDTTSPFQANPEDNPKEPLISIIARTKPLPIFTPKSIPINAARAAIMHYRRQRQEYLSHSFLFHLEIWLMQIGIAITAAIVLLANYLSIGYQTVEAYEFILVSFGGVIAGLVVVMLVLSPFSRLGRGVKGHTGGEVQGREQVEVSRVESKEVGVEEARSPTDVG